MLLFKTIEEVQTYVNIDNTLSLDTLKPKLREANTEVSRLMGSRLWALLAASHEASRLNVRLQKLLPFAQEAVAAYTLLYYAPGANIRLSDAGMHSRESGDSPRPYRYERREYLESLQESAEKASENLLVFLEQHERDYPEWTTSENCTLLRESLIKNVLDLQKHVGVAGRRLFLELKPYLKTAETKVRSALGTAFFDNIKAEMAELRVAERHEVLLPHLQEALAHFAAAGSSLALAVRMSTGKPGGKYLASGDYETLAPDARAMEGWRREQEQAGFSALAEAKRLIEARIYLYPAYKGAARFENKPESKTVIL